MSLGLARQGVSTGSVRLRVPEARPEKALIMLDLELLAGGGLDSRRDKEDRLELVVGTLVVLDIPLEDMLAEVDLIEEAEMLAEELDLDLDTEPKEPVAIKITEMKAIMTKMETGLQAEAQAEVADTVMTKAIGMKRRSTTGPMETTTILTLAEEAKEPITETNTQMEVSQLEQAR